MREETAVKPTTQPFSPLATGLLQRKCACGKHTTDQHGQCTECKKKGQPLQRRAVNQNGPEIAPPIVHEVLRSPGRPLDQATRAYMEPRFGHDFSQVRVHTDARAAESAQAVNALAYTVGHNVVFGAERYNPNSNNGRQLLAHELAHVLQQSHPVTSPTHNLTLSDPSQKLEMEAEAISEAVILQPPVAPGPKQVSPHDRSNNIAFRRVATRRTNCPANTNAAPADPIATLTDIDSQAGGLVQATAMLLTIASALTAAGLRNPASGVDQAYQNVFGLPPARPGGFLNRLTGRVRPSLDEALSEEMNLLSRRYGLLSRFFSQPIPYRCGIPDSFGGCPQTAADCTTDDAGACAGVGAIFLCPSFWGYGTRQQAGILIHEAAHINWARVVHGAGGPGGNFRHAECYSEFVAQIFGFDMPPTGDPCVAPGP